ncbi:hypothetical protein [Aminipila terrae]|nr:hypothetical protein [Aminipila terrae]
MGDLETLISFLPNYVVCIDKSTEGGALTGRIYSGYKKFSSINFNDLHEMLIIIEEIMDTIQCPGAGANKRGFKNKMKSVALNSTEIREAKKAMRKFDTGNESGQKATFILQIKFRQNASWQGTVQWVEKKQTLNFRSALELIKIIDSATEQGYKAEVVEMDQEVI